MEQLDKYKARVKRHNEAVKEKYDRVSATLPKGTIDRIKSLKITVNAAINESLLAYLDELERSQPEMLTEAPVTPEDKKAEPVQEEEPEQIGFTFAKMLEAIRGGESPAENQEKEAARAASIHRADAES